MLNGCRHYMNTKFNAKVYIVTEDMHGCGIRAQKCACGGGGSLLVRKKNVHDLPETFD